MAERVYLLPLWLRLWHWANAALILLLIATGASLHFAAPDRPLVPFALARLLHNTAGLALVAAYAVFVVGNLVSGNWWQYVPKPQGFARRARLQTRYYLWGIFRGEPHPFPVTLQENFNALQQVTYWSVMYLVMPALILTGLVFMWPELAPDRVFGIDGLAPVAIAHSLLGFVVTLFLIAHVYLGTMGDTATSQYRTILTGWHEVGSDGAAFPKKKNEEIAP
jgi:thiosulfate reductase cytochrome b subunit